MTQVTDLEQRLIDAAQDGAELDLSAELTRSIRSWVISDLLRGAFNGSCDPRGVRLRGAEIEGVLNLADMRVAVPLVLVSCEFDSPIVLTRAQLPLLALDGSIIPGLAARDFRCDHDFTMNGVLCSEGMSLMAAQIGGLLSLKGARINSSDVPALSAERIVVRGNVYIDDGFQAASASRYGTVRFVGGQISGQFSLRDAELVNSKGPALMADGIEVKSDMIADGRFIAKAATVEGAIRLDSAKIGNSLSLQGAFISNPDGAALLADRITVSNEMLLDGRFRAVVASSLGCVRLAGAKIVNTLSLRTAYIRNAKGSALRADGLAVQGSVQLDDIWAVVASPDGAVRLAGAQIGGQMSLRNARISNSSGPALHADGLNVKFDAFFDGHFHADADAADGVVRIPGATVGGQVSFSGAYLTNDNGAALEASGLIVGGNLYLDNRFRAESCGEFGSVVLSGASIGGQVILKGAYLTNLKGPALEADGVSVNGSGVFMGEDFRAKSASTEGAVRIPGGNLSGQLSLRKAYISNSLGPALVADRLSVKSDVHLEMLHAEGAGPLGVVRLAGVEISGGLSLKDSIVKNRSGDLLCVELSEALVSGALTLPIGLSGFRTEAPGYVNVNGLRYSDTPRDASLEEWLTLLRYRTARYFAQPYQQLASVYRATGHDRDVRQILVAQQRDLRRRGGIGGPIRKLMHIVSGATIGYGYRPWRALMSLLLVVCMSVTLMLLAKQHDVVSRPKSAGGGACTVAESIGLAADTAIPLLNTGSRQRCEVSATAEGGDWFLGISFSLQVLGWAFATLFVAGYTGIVRKT